jgi:hypothetical protein
VIVRAFALEFYGMRITSFQKKKKKKDMSLLDANAIIVVADYSHFSMLSLIMGTSTSDIMCRC